MTDKPIENITEALEPAEAEQQLQIPDELPLLPLRDIVIYPFMIVPLFVSREKSIRAVDEALGEHRMILLTCQKDLDKEEPQQDDLYKVGTVAVIMRMLKLPDGRIRIDYQPNNLAAHDRLVREMRKTLHGLGFWKVMAHSHKSKNTLREVKGSVLHFSYWR